MTSGAVATKSAEDQVAVTGLLESGAVAVMQFRGGTSRATGFHWEINGTQGELVVKADHSLFGGRLRLYGARGDDSGLTELPVPVRYQRLRKLPRLMSARPSRTVVTPLRRLRAGGKGCRPRTYGRRC
ncbi:hypothetical protein [Dactylosporangium cerinum]